ncbi:ATP-binding protein [Nosema bombycis CQ1]|uniref:ATP-binding protein n=1 Tax=Nosema bombycis (strain CQ1 / CVCC 102059) TaxID=578461 RepID=R0MI52_NOSB1|nr:ATP-binding protein [Nosema bombycis CQ1]|eukprot:EOB13820.1 ATP-binding protein [Nosema bombycis CQ1]
MSNEPNQEVNNEQKIEKSLENLKLNRTQFLVVGMAGAGKTTFCQRLYSWLSQENCKIDPKTGLNSSIYSINLDPAVLNCKMPLIVILGIISITMKLWRNIILVLMGLLLLL